MSIEGGVVDFRARDAVPNYRLTKQLVLIFDDMGSVERDELGETGQSTPTSIGADNSFSERRLMKTSLDGLQSVSAFDFRLRRGEGCFVPESRT